MRLRIHLCNGNGNNLNKRIMILKTLQSGMKSKQWITTQKQVQMTTKGHLDKLSVYAK